MTAPALADHPAAIACDTADAQATLGACLLGLEQFDAAERALRGALARDPLNAQGFGYLGALLLRTGRPVASETASRQAIALAPDEPRCTPRDGISKPRHRAAGLWRCSPTTPPDTVSCCWP